MARDGSGTFNRAESDYVYDTVIDESAVNTEMDDVAAALTASIAKDGQTNPAANLPMATYRHTGVGNATARTDYAAVGQAQDGSFVWCGTAGGAADAITLTPSPAITAYAAGQKFRWKASANGNTGAATVAISGLTTKALELNDAALVAGNHAANKYYEGLYDGTAFQITRQSVASTGMANVVEDASPQLGGALDPNSQFIGMDKGGDIASASPLVIDTDGDYFDVTGTTGFAAMTVAANRHFFLQFDAALTMTHHATNLDLPGEANITTVAGDVAEFFSTGSNTVQCVNYIKADGTAVVASVVDDTTPQLGGALDGQDNIVSEINLKDYGEITNALGDLAGGTDDIDLTAGNVVTATVSTSTETFTFSNPTASDEGCSFTLILTNGGSQTVNWPASVDWAGGEAPSLTASGVDILVFLTVDGGTIWHGAIASTDSS
jgi:hypothetical protein